MSILCAEAYLHALRQFPPPRSPSRLGRSAPRALVFLNALATLLVSKDTGEVYAVALKPPSPYEPPTLYIAGNETIVPQETQEHCRIIAKYLCDISAKFAGIQSSPVADVVEHAASDLIEEFHILVTRYSLSKIRKRVNKITEKRWTEHKQRCRGFLESDSQRQAFDDLTSCIDAQRYLVDDDNTIRILLASTQLEDLTMSEAGKDALDCLENFRGYGE